MQTVYIETSFVSYLTARPSRTIVGAAHQEITRDWWSRKRTAFNLRISELVVRECAAGDPEAARRRLVDAIAGIARLEINVQVEQIALGCWRARSALQFLPADRQGLGGAFHPI